MSRWFDAYWISLPLRRRIRIRIRWMRYAGVRMVLRQIWRLMVRRWLA